MGAHHSTLPAVLLERYAAAPEAEACRLVAADGTWESISMRRLMRRALGYAAGYGGAGARRKRIAISLHHGLDLHAAFVGGLLSGHIPTMLAPPSPRMDRAKYADAFKRMLRHIAPDHWVVDESVRETLTSGLTDLEALPDIIDPAVVVETDGVVHTAIDPDTTALVQHSSGTTGLQKGVALSHRQVLAHNEAYARRLTITPNDLIVSWLPLYHDMGFIACFMLPLLRGVTFVEISPFDWVRSPGILLEQIHQHRGTLCWLPNFAFAFMAQSVRGRQLPPELDLSCVRAWINCSEPVYHASHTAFLERFGRHGASAGQLTASYAMAENVFAVTQSLPGKYRTLRIDREAFVSLHRAELSVADDALTFVSNGRVLEGTEVAIVHGGAVLPPNHVGEIAIRGVHRFSGYLGRDDLTAAAIDSAGWYHTGDLGFMHDDELYVTGRKKDLLIIQGRNFYPADVEDIVAHVPGIAAGRVAAFGVADEASGTDKLVVVAEPDPAASVDERRLALTVRNHIAQELDCTPGDVRIVPPRWLVKSTSGKVARGDNRSKYLEQFAAANAKP